MHDLTVLSVVCGMVWMTANLWCLNKALQAVVPLSWPDTSSPPREPVAGPPVRSLRAWCFQTLRKRAPIGWFLVKFPLLYGLAVFLLTRPNFSPVGFGTGLTGAMVVAILIMVAQSMRAQAGT